MKIGAQVYVRGSLEAADCYCHAFDAAIRFFVKDEKGNYAHSELFVGDDFLMNVSEAPYDFEEHSTYPWRTTAFNVLLGSEAAVRKAFDMLSDGGTVIEPVGPCPWSECCATIIDKFGVLWWIAI